MTAGTTTFDTPADPGLGSRLGMVVSDTITVTKRNVIKIKRVPDVLIFSTLSPIMFVLLFAYVFGTAIEVPGLEGGYREFLIAGIFAQTVVFGSSFTGASLAEDMQKGIIDRFRSLPMAPSAVLVGRTVSDVVINLVSLVVMSVTGLLVGWRIRGSFLDAVLAYVLLLLFAYAVSWIMAVVGLLVRSPEVFNNASFMVMFPLTFLANTFVPIEELPTVLRVFAEWNPVSALTLATRELFGNTGALGPQSDAWSMRHPIATTLIWVVVILVVFVPLALRQYKRAVSR
ncbi:ABC-2 type transport system permease protein [Nocardia farcinica]|uniref:Transport permease protein n=3 Tax=Nocardia farcinica TaxID=37329 RepID=Q5Z3S7_NOCFA|nr:Daunorubicin/doxorubicin resistance ABC transporter permease protein DrrB [Nocardia farcinica]SLH55767.1 multidrug ABC transporter permease [Mycobacteroides abscessus subsp. abscessus]BAD54914.1 putative ABC transporter membrane protein [Nocardia farcinica IFM 10152]PFX08863.1 Daunorubicin/doxorubicin resistance ABC transporter permease protein DrrB [Nocardia farcinica]CRY81034.1 Daunorubicin/doxorubicin resistance ABC transporter permease protein drrB [Nocardia farcinica]